MCAVSALAELLVFIPGPPRNASLKNYHVDGLWATTSWFRPMDNNISDTSDTHVRQCIN